MELEFTNNWTWKELELALLKFIVKTKKSYEEKYQSTQKINIVILKEINFSYKLWEEISNIKEERNEIIEITLRFKESVKFDFYPWNKKEFKNIELLKINKCIFNKNCYIDW